MGPLVYLAAWRRQAPTIRSRVVRVSEEHAVFEDIEFDDILIAKMMANIAANGMMLADLGG